MNKFDTSRFDGSPCLHLRTHTGSIVTVDGQFKQSVDARSNVSVLLPRQSKLVSGSVYTPMLNPSISSSASTDVSTSVQRLQLAQPARQGANPSSTGDDHKQGPPDNGMSVWLVRMIVPFQRSQLLQLPFEMPDTVSRHCAGAAAQTEHPVMPEGQQGVLGNMNHARGATNGCHRAGATGTENISNMRQPSDNPIP